MAVPSFASGFLNLGFTSVCVALLPMHVYLGYSGNPPLGFLGCINLKFSGVSVPYFAILMLQELVS